VFLAEQPYARADDPEDQSGDHQVKRRRAEDPDPVRVDEPADAEEGEGGVIGGGEREEENDDAEAATGGHPVVDVERADLPAAIAEREHDREIDPDRRERDRRL
jgi:hypothetical protein